MTGREQHKAVSTFFGGGGGVLETKIWQKFGFGVKAASEVLV